MALGKRTWGVVLWVVLSAVAGVVRAHSEADWFYTAAQFVARFEAAGSAELTPPARELQYHELLGEVSAFAEAKGLGPREQRGRRAFGLLMAARIQEQLGSMEAAGRARRQYAALKETVEPVEKVLLTQLLERTEARAQAFAPRVCEVEARGKEVRVKALDYPIEGVLAKMAEAAGEKAAVPPEVSGFVDCVEAQWAQVSTAVGLLVHPMGLALGTSGPGAALRIVVVDRLYTASIGERADARPRDVKPVQPEQGIRTGYVIVRGCYVPPPYYVELRTEGERRIVYVNGVPAGQGFTLTRRRPAPAQLPTPENAAQIGVLGNYAGQQYANLKAQYGQAEAVRRVSAFLDQQKAITSYRFHKDESLELEYPNGRTDWILLRGRKPDRKFVTEKEIAEEATEDEKHRQHALQEADEFRELVQAALNSGGLLMVCGQSQVMPFTGTDADRRLNAILTALDEVERTKQNMATALVGSMHEKASDWAWEVILNCRHRELHRRLRHDAK
jgi:hypothetical protein